MKSTTPRSLPMILPIATLLCGCIIGAYIQNLSLRRGGAMIVEGIPEAQVAYEIGTRLVERLGSEDPGERCFAAGVFGQLGDLDNALPVLEQALNAEDPAVRRSAAIALGQLGPSATPDIAGLIDHLADDDKDVRGFCVSALGAMGAGAREAVPHLFEVLEREGNADICRAVAQSLAQIGDVEALTGYLEDDNTNVRLGAAVALGLLGEEAASSALALAASLDDPVREVQMTAISALGAIGPKAHETISDLFELLPQDDQNLRRAIVEALARIGDVSAVVEHLSNNDADIRTGAVVALGLMGDNASATVRDIGACLDDEVWTVRYNAVMALGRIGESAASVLPQIEQACADDDPRVSQAAQETLAAISDVSG